MACKFGDGAPRGECLKSPFTQTETVATGDGAEMATE